MAEIIVNYLVERLLELGRDYVELIAGVQENVNDLRENLEELQAFLKDASKIYRNDNEAWQQALKEIRTVVYQAEDAIDKFILEAKKHQLLNQAVKWADAPYWLAVAKVASQVKCIQKKVRDVREKNLKLLEDNKTGSLSGATSDQPIEHTVSEDDDVVGLEEATKYVVERLIGGSQTLVEAVPIFGMTGLGKSTLARKVYKHPKIIGGFFPHIWVNVTEKYTKKEVLLKILTHFTKQINEHEKMTDDQLIDEIQFFLEKAGRCLIVLDDVWDKNVRDIIQLVFPKNNIQGHRIMMTTRQRVAAAAFNEDIYEQEYLSDANSWLLLKKKVFKRDTCSGDLEEPGYSIATKCGGLPLAVVVIAGALIDRKTKKEWEQVDRNIGAHLLTANNLQDSCLEFVRMSYDRLSYATKACFLYCATFPRGFEIHAWKLIRLWIAEGFIPFDENLTLEEQAEGCLSDLTKKSLVMVMARKSDGQIKTCRIHDMLYEFCRKVAKEQDLFEEAKTAPDQPSVLLPVSNICRRLCVDSSILGNFPSLFSKKKTVESVRSLLCFSSKQTEKSQAAMKTIDKAFPLIKVLELESLEFSLSMGFYRLSNLRYVSFSGDYKILPEPFGKFWNLETLIIHTTTRESTIDIKADIWNMTRLRHLHTNVPAKLPSPTAARSNKGCCLQSLSTIAPESCSEEVFARAPYIRKLGVKGNVVAELLETNTGALSNLDKLENLKLVHYVEKTKAVPLPNLVVIFPKALRKLTFFGTRLRWSEMTKLAQIESLEVLKLKEYAFQGEVWEPEIGGFSSLIVLWIHRTDLKTWHASSRNFPILKRLVLKSCDKLEGIPESLGDIPDLEEMKVESTHTAAVRSARIIEKKKLERRTSSSVAFKLSVFPDTDA